jgi:hypothetical protein
MNDRAKNYFDTTENSQATNFFLLKTVPVVREPTYNFLRAPANRHPAITPPARDHLRNMPPILT